MLANGFFLSTFLRVLACGFVLLFLRGNFLVCNLSSYRARCSSVDVSFCVLFLVDLDFVGGAILRDRP